jgi:hypothetical protein
MLFYGRVRSKEQMLRGIYKIMEGGDSNDSYELPEMGNHKSERTSRRRRK